MEKSRSRHIRRGTQRILAGMGNVPVWLDILAWIWISACLLSALVILAGCFRQPQKMGIMNVVWPVTGLYMGPVAVHMWRKALPVSAKRPMTGQMMQIQERQKDDPPTFFQNSIAVFHCGAGCSLGDIAAESICGTLMLSFAAR